MRARLTPTGSILLELPPGHPRYAPIFEAITGRRLLESADAGFTGIDGHGHKWVNGKQVKRDAEPTAAPTEPAHPASTLDSIRATAADAKAVAGRIGDAAWNKLPPKLQAAAAQLYAGGKHVLHIAEAPFRKGREMAQAVAAERGHSVESVERLGRILGTADLLAAWTVNFPLVTAATANPLLGKASSWVPIASMAYVAYSTGRNPVATLRAAHKLVGGRSALMSSLESDDMAGDDLRSLAALLLPKIEARGDWYESLLVAAMDQEHDLARAAVLADEVYGQTPEEPEEEADVDDSLRESLEGAILEAGFTGEVTDSLGRKRHYVDGKQVAGHDSEQSSTPTPARHDEPKQAPAHPTSARTDGEVAPADSDKQSKPIQFEPAKNIKGAEAIAKQHLVKGNANFKGIDVQMANLVNSHLFKRFNQLPFLNGALDDIIRTKSKMAVMGIFWKPTGEAALALGDTAKTPDAAEDYWERSLAFKEKQDQNRYAPRSRYETFGSPLWAGSHLPKQTASTALLDHELGHLIEYKSFTPEQRKQWEEAYAAVPRTEWERLSYMAGIGKERGSRRGMEGSEAFAESVMLCLNDRADLVPIQARDFVVRVLSSRAVTSSLESMILEAGFTGEVTDKLGRKIHYVNGKRVAAHHDEPKQPRPSAKPAPAAANKQGGTASGNQRGGSPKDRNSPRRQPPPEAEPLSDKAKRAKAAHVLIDRSHQRYAEEHNEPRLAKVLGGQSHPDNEPKDISTDKDLIEMKTLLSNGNDKLTMDSYSQVRKIVAEREEGKTFHTIVSDDRRVFNARGDGQHDDSQRVYYYRRGVAGSARIGSMHLCESEAELKRVMAMPDDQLPEAARRTDGKLRVGRWKPFVDERGKGFKNLKTGQEFRAKK